MDAATLFFMVVQHDLLYWEREAELAHMVQRPGCELGERGTVFRFSAGTRDNSYLQSTSPVLGPQPTCATGTKGDVLLGKVAGT
jgi:hypothetical protein